MKLNSESFYTRNNRSQIDITPSLSNTSSDNIIAYRPNYRNVHGDTLATIFVNLEAVYPCIVTDSWSMFVSCKLFPFEDDGFLGQRVIFEASDNGGDFSIFGSSVTTYAFTVEGCTQLTSSCINVPENYHTGFLHVCFLPNSRCSNTS